jgi:long-chain fatty acid transport protein
MVLTILSRVKRVSAVFLPVFFCNSVFAAGFYVSEIGTPSSLGTAGAANATNTIGADSSWSNPAGMTGLAGDQLMAGAQAVLPKVKFDASVAEAGGSDSHNAGEKALIPSFFYVKKLSENGYAGFSIVAPLGGGMNFGEQFVGRYGAYKVKLAGVGFSPSFGYKLNENFSVGGGVSILYTALDEYVALNLPGSLPDGKLKIENATDWGYQPFLGLTYHLSTDTLLGVVYRAEADVDLEGDLNFRNLGAVPTPRTNTVELGWDNPQTLTLGIRHKVKPNWSFLASVNWEDWSQFSKNSLIVSGGAVDLAPQTIDRNWKDTYSLKLGLAHFWNKQAATIGASYDSSPVDDKDRTIDMPFDETYKISAAYGWKESERLDFSLGSTLMYLGEAKVDQTAQGARFQGKFDENYILFIGATLRYTY